MRLRNCIFAHIRASKSESVSEGEIVRRSERINRRRRREKKKEATGRLTLCVNHWEGKMERRRGARGKFDEVEVVYLACPLPLAG